MNRCGWVNPQDQMMVEYHDQEWGVPVHDDRKHFEFLVLEGAQAGLSWSTILKRREGYRSAFIIRNRQKIEATVRNARAFLAIQNEFESFDSYCWLFVNGRPIVNHRRSMKEVPATSPESDSFSKDLKKRGFGFVGSTIIYAHMQAVGMVNDHLVDCFRYGEV